MAHIYASILVTSIASGVFILDRLAKLLATKSLALGQSVNILPCILNFTLVFNKGAAFGLFNNQALLFISLSLVAISAILYYLWKNNVKDPLLSIALALILGGALGNLADRVCLGYVIDFIDLRVWPVFNVADSSITIGATILAIKILSRRDSR